MKEAFFAAVFSEADPGTVREPSAYTKDKCGRRLK